MFANPWPLWNENTESGISHYGPFRPRLASSAYGASIPRKTGRAPPRRKPADPRPTRNGNAASEGYSRGRESCETWQTRQALGSKFLTTPVDPHAAGGFT